MNAGDAFPTAATARNRLDNFDAVAMVGEQSERRWEAFAGDGFRLYNATTQQYLWASQSLDDNNEGFDYTLQPGEGGVLQLIVVWQQGALSCEGTTFEPSALSWFASH